MNRNLTRIVSFALCALLWHQPIVLMAASSSSNRTNRNGEGGGVVATASAGRSKTGKPTRTATVKAALPATKSAKGLNKASRSSAQEGGENGGSVTVLSDGRVLLVGGQKADGSFERAQIKDPRTGISAPLQAAGPLSDRAWHTATVLPDGRVLLFGGLGVGGKVVSQAEIFDPQTGDFSALDIPGLTPRARHTATLLTDGSVLFIGGQSSEGEAPLATAELWNTQNNATVPAQNNLQVARLGHTATLLADGGVLVAGGQDGNSDTLTTSERYDANTHTFSTGTSADDQQSSERPPQVVFSDPADGSSDIPVGQRIALRFSKPLKVETLNPQTVRLEAQQQNSVPVQVVAAEGGMLAFIAAGQAFEPGVTYRLGVSGATDAEGLEIKTASISFTTIAADAAAPNLAGVNNPAGVGGNNSGVGTTQTAEERDHHRQHVSQSADAQAQSPHPPEKEEWIPTVANFKENWRTNRPESPHQKLPPLQAAAGETAVSGQILNLDGEPVAGVTMFMGTRSAVTDATGRFLLTSLSPGRQGLVIGGYTVNRPGAQYGTFEALVDVEAGKTTSLPFTVWLPLLDQQNATSLVGRTATEVVASSPRIPGFAVRIPEGVILRHPDGSLLTSLTMTPLPMDRTPIPAPAGAKNGMMVSLQLHGAKTEEASGRIGKGLTVIYPNYNGEAPGTKLDLWNYDPKGRGWYIYGKGTVSDDGVRVIPDAGSELQGAYCVIYLGGGAPSPAPPPCGATDGDPVDLVTGLFVFDKTDLILPDTIPIVLTRTYRPADSIVRSFGLGMTNSYDIFLTGDNTTYQYADLILPNGARVRFNRTSPGTGYPAAVMEAQSTPTACYKTILSYNSTRSPNGWDLKWKDGTIYQFNPSHSLTALSAIVDRYGNKLTISRIPTQEQNNRITRITSPNGRWVDFSYATGNRVSQIADNTGRIVTYTYNANNTLWKVTDAGNGVTEYSYDAFQRMLTIKDPKFITYLTNEYDTSGRIKKQTMADSTTYQMAYTTDSGGNVTQTEVTDQRGKIRRVIFNSSGYPTTDTYAVGTTEQQTITYARQAGTNKVTSVTDALNRQTSYSYYPNGNIQTVTWLAGTPQAVSTTYTYEPNFNQLATVTDPLNHTTTYAYDDKGNLTSIADALSHQTIFTYFPTGQIRTVTDALGNASEYSYDGGDLIKVTDPLGRVATSVYDGAGRARNVINPLGQITKYSYDNLNQVKKVTDPQGNITQFSYDPNGNLLQVTDARNKITTYTYDNMDRVLTRVDQMQGPNSTETYTYDEAGNTKTFTDRRGKVTAYTYDNLNRLSTVGFERTGTFPNYTYESTINYSYDAADRLTQAVDSWSGTITRSYNDQTRTYSETTPQGTITYVSDNAGRLQSKTVAGQTQITYAFDNADRLTGITQGSSNVGFIYDNANRRTKLTLPNGLSMNYGYDNASQLTGIIYKNGIGATIGDLTYGYDLTGRRTSVGGSYAVTGLPMAETGKIYNDANRLTQRGAATLAYDNNGNLTDDGVGNTLTWNARNQLTSITGGVSASFQYNAFGRRISKTISGVTTKFLYDGANVVQEQNAGGTPIANMLTGSVDEVFSRTDAGGARDFLAGALGSTLALTDNAGAVQTTYTFDPFGLTTPSGSASINTSQYTGRENDGTGLYFYRARYYSPTLQRFISEDHIGFAGGDINLYAYVGNNPANFNDPFGNINPGAAFFFSPAGVIIIGGGIIIYGLYLYTRTPPFSGRHTLEFPSCDFNFGPFSSLPPSKAPASPLPPPPPFNAGKGPDFLGQENGPALPVPVPPANPATKPGPDFDWKGKDAPGGRRGNWHNPKTGESLHPDIHHPAPIGPHWDWKDANGNDWRVYPDGRVEAKP